MMKQIKKIFLISCLAIILSTSFSVPEKTYAANIFGFSDPAGCGGNDPFLPTLVICGRNPSSGACTAYTQPCSIGDLVETLSRSVVWFIAMVLLVVPIIIMYYAAVMMVNVYLGKDGINPSKLKEIKGKLGWIILYFILMLGGWLIVRTVVDIFQVDDRINTFLIDENGQSVKARTFNTNN